MVCTSGMPGTTGFAAFREIYGGLSLSPRQGPSQVMLNRWASAHGGSRIARPVPLVSPLEPDFGQDSGLATKIRKYPLLFPLHYLGPMAESDVKGMQLSYAKRRQANESSMEAPP